MRCLAIGKGGGRCLNKGRGKERYCRGHQGVPVFLTKVQRGALKRYFRCARYGEEYPLDVKRSTIRSLVNKGLLVLGDEDGPLSSEGEALRGRITYRPTRWGNDLAEGIR